MEVTETSLCVMSLTLMDPSVFSMIRITQLLFATAIQVFLLPRMRNWQRQKISASRNLTGREEEEQAKWAKRTIIPSVRFTRTQYFGLFCVVAGVLVVYLAASEESTNPTSAANTLLGTVLVLIAMVTLSLETAVQEHVLTNYGDVLEPMEMIGLQGVSCTLWSLLIIGCANMISNAPHDDIVLFLAQVSDGWQGPLSVVCVVFCTMGVDCTGTYLTRAMTANVRPALQPLRSGIIWLVGLSTGASHYSLVRLFGFLTSALGSMLFKQMFGRSGNESAGADEHWTATFGVRNITDKKYISHGFDLSDSLGYQLAYYGAPRTWSLGLKYRY